MNSFENSFEVLCDMLKRRIKTRSPQHAVQQRRRQEVDALIFAIENAEFASRCLAPEDWLDTPHGLLTAARKYLKGEAHEDL